MTNIIKIYTEKNKPLINVTYDRYVSTNYLHNYYLIRYTYQIRTRFRFIAILKTIFKFFKEVKNEQ